MDQQNGSPAKPEGDLPGPLGRRLTAHILDAAILFLPLLALWAVALRDM
ncbi:MAG: hypothetical protein GWP18_06905, partial [Proteobacteria bacterium]|nr:hypothetical protein [Pseudomonadota bacterium]